MVHLDKVEGQRGSMVIQEDGSVISSTGTLSSSEQTAQTIISLLNHNLQVDFNSAVNNNNQSEVNNGDVAADTRVGDLSGNNQIGVAPVLKWNRLTVSFPTHSYVACLSNKKIHVVDRDSSKPAPNEPDDDVVIAPDNSELI